MQEGGINVRRRHVCEREDSLRSARLSGESKNVWEEEECLSGGRMLGRNQNV